MNYGVRQLACVLTASILFSFFFFLGSTTCRVTSISTQTQGGFCSVEKASTPLPLSFEDPHFVLVVDLFVLCVFFVLFTYTQIIVRRPCHDSKLTRRKNTGIIRYGPYTKIFLPYLTATHGM